MKVRLGRQNAAVPFGEILPHSWLAFVLKSGVADEGANE